MDAGDPFGGKGPIEALREWFGERVLMRRTYGDPALTRAVLLCHVMEDELGIKGMKAIADILIHGRSAEQGWDTDKSIQALAATAAKVVHKEAPGKGGGGEE